MKTINDRLKDGKDLPSMEELEDDFARNFGQGLVGLGIFVFVVILIYVR